MNLRHFRVSAAVVVGLAAPVMACTTTLVNPQIPPPGTPDFQDGYFAGCSSGFADAGRDGYEQGYRKDTHHYATVPDYRQGWDQGQHACFEEEKRHPKIIGAGGSEPP